MLSSLKEQDIQPDLMIRLWFREKRKIFFCFFPIVAVVIWLLQLAIPMNYHIEAEYLLKKKSSGAYEAIALPNQINEKVQEALSIEPFFFARTIKEETISNAALQIREDRSAFSQLKASLQGYFLILLKKELFQPYQFESCHYKGYRNLYFSIRGLGSQYFEINFNGERKKYSIDEKVRIGDAQFYVKNYPKEHFYWDSFVIVPMEKALKKFNQRLKIRYDKNAKNILRFSFFHPIQKQGENCLEILIKKAQMKAESLKREAIQKELFTLEEMDRNLAINQEYGALKESLNIEERQIQQILEMKAGLQKKLKEELLVLDELLYLKNEKKIAPFKNEISRQYYELMKKKEQLSKLQSDGENVYLKESLASLEELKKSKQKNLEALCEEVQILEQIKRKMEFSSYIQYQNFPGLNALFDQKRSLEKIKKDLAYSEKEDQLKEVKELEVKISDEVAFLNATYRDRISDLKNELFLINQAIYELVEKEIYYTAERYFEALTFEIKMKNLTIQEIKEEIKSIDAQLTELKLDYQILLKKLEHAIALAQTKKEIERKILVKKIDLDTENFFGSILSAPKSTDFPLGMLKIFISLALSFLIALFIIGMAYIQAASKGWFPSSLLIKRMGLKEKNLSSFKKIQAKKILIAKGRHFLSQDQFTFIKNENEFELSDIELFPIVGIQKGALSLDQIETILNKQKEVYFIKSSFFQF